MTYSIPHPGRTALIPIVALLLGSAGGVVATSALKDADTIRVVAPARAADSIASAPSDDSDQASRSANKLGTRP